MEKKSWKQERMEATFEGGQGPEGAVAPYMEWNYWTDIFFSRAFLTKYWGEGGGFNRVLISHMGLMKIQRIVRGAYVCAVYASLRQYEKKSIDKAVIREFWNNRTTVSKKN